MNTVVFRVDANTRLGIGHLMRCINLANQLSLNSVSCLFVLSNSSAPCVEKILSNGHECIVLENDTDFSNTHNPHSDYLYTCKVIEKLHFKPKWLVIDHYEIDIFWETHVRPYVEKILVIDDLANRPHDCDALADHNLYDNFHIYDHLVGSNCRKYIGLDYAIINSDFSKNRIINKIARHKIQHIGIFMGGGDHLNISEWLLDHLGLYFDWLDLKQIKIDLIIGEQHPAKEALLTKYRESVNIKLHVDVSDMASLLRDIDIFIGAGGVSAIERCCLGIPSIVLVFADNQIRGVKALQDKGALIYGGDFRDSNWLKDFQRAVTQIQNVEYRDKMIKYSMRLVDGHGCDRICASMLIGIFEPAFRLVEKSDCDLLWHWRNLPEVRRVSENANLISHVEHEAWFNRVYNSDRYLMVMVCLGNHRVGYVRYSVDDNDCYISVVVDPIYKKFGFGYLLLVQSIPFFQSHQPTVKCVSAKIKSDNIASLKLFTKAGYNPVVTDREWVQMQLLLNGNPK